MIQRKTISYSFEKKELANIKAKMLNWLRPFSIFAYLDNNEYAHQPNRYELLIGAGALQTFSSIPEVNEDWLFGHIAYDYKNVVEPQLSSNLPSNIAFDDCKFFRPEIVIAIEHGSCTLNVYSTKAEPQDILNQITNSVTTFNDVAFSETIQWHHFFTQDEYVNRVEQIRQHIEEGDCYELNFCTGAKTQVKINPVATFQKLNFLNPSPFAALYRNNDNWLICASPERFVYRNDQTIISQPIKGTARRSADAVEDKAIKEALLLDEKERAENVMIVDLVRNDIAKSSEIGSVKVAELFGVYSFPQVHQLISTVEGTIKEGVLNANIIDNAFPMGSMTGAPKVMVMELVEKFERCRRNVYAGTIGYIAPTQDFDFNVVIRSLFYNEDTQVLSYQTGGAITYDSMPEQEWEEVRLKAKAMEQIFK